MLFNMKELEEYRNMNDYSFDDMDTLMSVGGNSFYTQTLMNNKGWYNGQRLPLVLLVLFHEWGCWDFIVLPTEQEKNFLMPWIEEKAHLLNINKW